MLKKLQKLLFSQGAKSASIVTFGNLTGTAVSAIAMILFSRFLGPEEFGIFSALFSFFLLLPTLANLGFDIAAQRYIARHLSTSLKKAESMMHTLWRIRVILYFVVMLIGLVASPFLAHNFLKIPQVNLVRLALILSFTAIGFEYFSVITQALQRFTLLASITILQGTIKLLGAIVLYLTQVLSATTAFYLYTLAPLTGVILAFFKIRIKPWFKPTTLSHNLQALKKTTPWIGLSLISAKFADHFDILLVQNLLNSYQTGIYSIASRMAAFAGLIGISVGMVLNVRVAQYKNKKNLDKYLKKARLASLLMFVLILLLTPLSRLALTLTVGQKYLPATLPLILLLISTALTSATSPFVALFYLFKKPQYYAYSGILLLITLIGGDLFLIPRLGIVGAGLVKIITRLIVLLFTFVYARKSYKEHFNLT